MNRDQFTPNNNGTGELNQGEVIDSLLFVTNQEFSKAVHKRMYHLYDPAAGSEPGVMLQLLLFLPARSDVRGVIPELHLVLMAGVTCVHAKVLRHSLTGFGAFDDQTIESISEQLHIMCVCAGEDNSQRQPVFIRQNRPFCPHFFLDP